MRMGWPLVAAAGIAGYAVGIERTAFTVRHVEVPTLPPGSSPVRVLHLSDAHMTPRQHRKQAWISSLAALQPDLVVNTGDNVGHPGAGDALIDSYRGLLEFPGVFVFGSNDYYSPKPKNPLSYLRRNSADVDALRSRPRDMPYELLHREFCRAGWLDLSNAHGQLTVNGVRMSFAGVDDPHLALDDPEDAPADPSADITIGVTHAPYRRVLNHWNRRGFHLLLAGHTHGGQVCLPGYGALVTNCDLPRSMAKGLHRYLDQRQASSWLHVSAGIGTSPWQPVRFACRPEATLLTLTG